MRSSFPGFASLVWVVLGFLSGVSVARDEQPVTPDGRHGDSPVGRGVVEGIQGGQRDVLQQSSGADDRADSEPGPPELREFVGERFPPVSAARDASAEIVWREQSVEFRKFGDLDKYPGVPHCTDRDWHVHPHAVPDE